MKRLAVFLLALFASVTAISAQNYMVVDSEKIFKSIAAYNSAISEIETLSTSYQANVDARFEAVEKLYQNYVAQRAYFTTAEQQARESEILQKEAEAEEYQEKIFSTDGELMKRRLELISPIQERVFSTIEEYAKANGFDLVMDIAANATILYKSQNIDRTDEVIMILK